MRAFHSKTFRMYYICKDRVHYVAMPCSQFGYNNVYIISGVMNMVCCNVVPYLYTVLTYICTMTNIKCTQKCIYMYMYMCMCCRFLLVV